jgi:hypothetical protein
VSQANGHPSTSQRPHHLAHSPGDPRVHTITHELAEKYNLNLRTMRQWRHREDLFDASHRPHNLPARLTPEQEVVVVALRALRLLPLDELLAITHQFIHIIASRSGLDRCLHRHGVSNLKVLIKARKATVEGEKAAKTSFKAYDPGFIHVDVKYLPQMPDGKRRKYLFVAINRATRWAYPGVLKD